MYMHGSLYARQKNRQKKLVLSDSSLNSTEWGGQTHWLHGKHIQISCMKWFIFLKTEHALYLVQFAYRPHRGVENATVTLLYLLVKHLEERGSHVRLSFVNLSTAFNTIQPHILNRRLLKHFDLSNNLVGWILDFLTKRTQRVRVYGILSDQVCSNYWLNWIFEQPVKPCANMGTSVCFVWENCPISTLTKPWRPYSIVLLLNRSYFILWWHGLEETFWTKLFSGLVGRVVTHSFPSISAHQTVTAEITGSILNDNSHPFQFYWFQWRLNLGYFYYGVYCLCCL